MQIHKTFRYVKLSKMSGYRYNELEKKMDAAWLNAKEKASNIKRQLQDLYNYVMASDMTTKRLRQKLTLILMRQKGRIVMACFMGLCLYSMLWGSPLRVQTTESISPVEQIPQTPVTVLPQETEPPKTKRQIGSTISISKANQTALSTVSSKQESWPKQDPFKNVMRNVWVYSVFYEPCRKDGTASQLRGIAIAPVSAKRTVSITCTLVYEDNSTEISQGYVQSTHDTHHLEFSAAFVQCPLLENARPKYVGFSSSMNRLPQTDIKHFFNIIYPGTQQTRAMTVCYGVMFGQYDDVSTLMQNVEYNRVMGAEHFVLYIADIGQNLTRLTTYYEDQGLMTVLPMPAVPAANLSWYHGQIAAINDCVYRNRGHSRFVAVQDPDEYLMPLQHASWLELIEHIDLHQDSVDLVKPEDISRNKVEAYQPRGSTPLMIGSYAFQHYTYCPVHEEGLLTFLKYNLSLSESDITFIYANGVKLFLERYRIPLLRNYPGKSKTIYRAELTREPGIHFARTLLDNAVSAVISPEFGALAHLKRHWQKPKYFTGVFDTNARSYYQKYLNRLKKTYDEFLVL